MKDKLERKIFFTKQQLGNGQSFESFAKILVGKKGRKNRKITLQKRCKAEKGKFIFFQSKL